MIPATLTITRHCYAVDAVTPASPTSECPVVDSDRDTTFDDFDLENDERLEVTEMFQCSSDVVRCCRQRSDSDSDWSDSALFTIDIPASRSLTSA